MRALHLFSNWKWTGPAEPAVNLCRGLARLDTDVLFACGAPPGDAGTRSSVRERALERAITPVLQELLLSKHGRLLGNMRDVRRLCGFAAGAHVDLLHAHLPNAHSIAARVAGRGPVRVVRTSYDGDRLSGSFRERRALARTDALICVSKSSARDAVERLRYPRDRTFEVEAPIDTERFDADRCAALRDRGARLLGVGPDDYVVGIVARMQTHRRFEVLLEALRLAAQAVPRLRAAVIGRGTHQDVVAKEPARRLGLEERIRFPGYLDGDDYVAALAALDVKVFLVPGSDGSCRAVREALAMGKPVIAARRGMLPEVVRDGVTGLIVDDEPEALAGAIARLGLETETRRRLGAQARDDARGRFAVDRAAKEVRRVYELVLGRPRIFERERV